MRSDDGVDSGDGDESDGVDDDRDEEEMGHEHGHEHEREERGGRTRHPLPQPPPPAKAAEIGSVEDAELASLSTMMENFKWSNDAVESCARAIMDPQTSHGEKLKGVQQLKQLLCTSREHVFKIAQNVIDSGVLRGLVILAGDPTAGNELRLPCAFCLTNIAAGNDDQTSAVVAAGAIPVLLTLLTNSDEMLRRQAIFCLANIAGSTSEFRRNLASHSKYFPSICYAVYHATDPKVCELAGWNIRNMIVLGGPEFVDLKDGLEFFSDQLHRNMPAMEEVLAMIVAGVASLTAVTNGEATLPPSMGPMDAFGFGLGFGHGHGGPLSALGLAVTPFGELTRHHCAYNPVVLRFACETFSWLSREPLGRQFILSGDLALPLIFHAKFNATHPVRNHALETICNLAHLGDRAIRSELVRARVVTALSELLADNRSYSSHQRALAARALFWLVHNASPGEAAAFVAPVVMTRAVAQKILSRRRDELTARVKRLESAAAASAASQNAANPSSSLYSLSPSLVAGPITLTSTTRGSSRGGYNASISAAPDLDFSIAVVPDDNEIVASVVDELLHAFDGDQFVADASPSAASEKDSFDISERFRRQGAEGEGGGLGSGGAGDAEGGGGSGVYTGHISSGNIPSNRIRGDAGGRDGGGRDDGRDGGGEGGMVEGLETSSLNVSRETAERNYRGEFGQRHRPPIFPSSSCLDIAYTIYCQLEGVEEFSVREKCARLFLEILNRISEPLLMRVISSSLFALLLSILDVAVHVDTQQLFASGDDSTARAKDAGGGLGENAGGGSHGGGSAAPGITAIEALKPGEPALPPASFVTSVIDLVERLMLLGTSLVREQGLLENPMTALLQEHSGMARLESAINKALLPPEVITRFMTITERFG